MPIDPSIPLAAQAPPQPSVFQTLGQVMSLKAMADNAKIREMELQQRGLEFQTYLDERKYDQQLRDLFKSGEMPSPQQILAAGGPDRGPKIIQGITALQTAHRADVTSRQKLVRDVVLGLDALPEDQRSAAYPEIRNHFVQSGVIGENDAPPQYDPAWWATIKNFGVEPTKPTPFTLGAGQNRYDAAGRLVASGPPAEVSTQQHPMLLVEPPSKPGEAPRETEVAADYNPKTQQWSVAGKVYSTDPKQNTYLRSPRTTRSADQEMIEETARNISADPYGLTNVTDVMSMRSDLRARVYNAIKRINPQFDVGLMRQRVRFLEQYENPNGRSSINRTAMQNIPQHTVQLIQTAAQYGPQSARILGTPINKLREQYSAEYAQMMTPMNALRGEIQLYFTGGYAPMEEDKQRWDDLLAGNATLGQLIAFGKEIADVALVRADTENGRFRTVMGYDDPNLITPQAAEALTALGYADKVKKYESGGIIGRRAPVTGPPPPATPPTAPTTPGTAPVGNVLESSKQIAPPGTTPAAGAPGHLVPMAKGKTLMMVPADQVDAQKQNGAMVVVPMTRQKAAAIIQAKQGAPATKEQIDWFIRENPYER